MVGLLQRPVVDVIVGGGDETFKQGVRFVRFALKFGVELARNEERVVLQFDHFDKLATAAAALVEFQLSERGPLLRASALTALPETMRIEMVEASNRVSDRFASIICDGIAAGSVRAVDPYIAAQMLTATLNASAEINWWVPGVTRDQAAALYARPMLMGLFATSG